MPTKGEVYVAVTGTAVITGSSGPTENQYFIGAGGVATLHEQGGNDLIFVRQGGSLSLDGSNKMLNLQETDASVNFDFTNGGVERAGSFVGGAIQTGGGGAISIYSGANTNADIQLDQGSFSITSLDELTISAGAASVKLNVLATDAALTFIGGSGTATVSTNVGLSTITAGSGSLPSTNTHATAR